MDIKLKRVETNEDGVFGEFYDALGNLIAFSLEHNYGGSPKVPKGVYNCYRRYSPRFGFDLFCLENVPGHTFIEIHPGNIQADSDGCILIGEARQGKAVINSRSAFRKFMELQSGIDTITLTVE